jgi:hypothetical protein
MKNVILYNPVKWRLIILSSCLIILATYWLLIKSGVLADSTLRKNLEWPKTDFSKHIVELNEIHSGGPPKDGIPAIDTPKFISIEKANSWLNENEPVIALEKNNEIKAYPLQIMIYHEIVNDTVGGIPVSVTFCPLCNATIVFDRRVNNQVLDFGTTGKLRMSDMVMYDRQTQSWWQQFTGTGIVGNYAGIKLKQFTANIIAYRDFRFAFPNAKVLSRKTGYFRPYGKNPYRGYDKIGDIPFLFNDAIDDRLPAMERVIFIRNIDGQQRLYPFSIFNKQPVINDEITDLPVVLMSKQGTLSVLDESEIVDSRLIPSVTAWSRRLDDRILNFEYSDDEIKDMETGSSWDLLGHAIAGPLVGLRLEKVDSGVHFAFAWLAFNPDSDIYQQQ